MFESRDYYFQVVHHSKNDHRFRDRVLSYQNGSILLTKESMNISSHLFVLFSFISFYQFPSTPCYSLKNVTSQFQDQRSGEPFVNTKKSSGLDSMPEIVLKNARLNSPPYLGVFFRFPTIKLSFQITALTNREYTSNIAVRTSSREPIQLQNI